MTEQDEAVRLLRTIRGRLFEAAWRRGDLEWLDPKEVSRILDEEEAALATPPPAAPALDVERLRQALRNVNFTDASAWAAAIRDEYVRLSPEPEDA